jgi:hypothetical protein
MFETILKIKMKQNNILFLCFLCIVLSSISGCKTIENCEEHQIMGNMGNVVNTNLDEHSPSILVLPDDIKKKYSNTDTNEYLFFTATRYDLGTNEAIYNVLLNDIAAGAELLIDPTFPLNDSSRFRNAGVPVFRYNRETNKLDLFFAALPKKGGFSRDIFWATKDLVTNKWSDSSIQLSINSDRWESHPTISPDGQILLFASDRIGGEGDIDIWASYLNDDGTWGEPINLGAEINTKGIDYFPMFTSNNDFIFSTNGRGGLAKDFNIYYARYDSIEKRWHSPQKYGFPINTEYNDAGATIWKNRIFLSSDRRGGCGGKDIYSFQLCGPITIAGKVKSISNQNFEGQMYLNNEWGDSVGYSEVRPDGTFNIDVLEPNKNYILDYHNNCYPHKKNEYSFRSPCSDSSVVKIIVDMIMPEKTAVLELTEVEIPFFVTGYYKPNTEANLNSLRLGFSYNLYGSSSKSKYIENPDDKYNGYVSEVEANLDEVVKYIANMVSVLENKCLPTDKKGVLNINVQGWADPRNISPDAEFMDSDIDDAKFGMKVKKGSKMDNNLLSQLRAYFTAKYFEAKLAEEFDLKEIGNSIRWTIEGKGVDATTDVEDGLKRKVKITLQYDE